MTVTTLENVVYLGYKNDVSFLVDMALYLVEHQGSWNPNMPLRGVFTTPALECQALMLNINYGSNQKLLENCRPLMEYSQFIYQIRQYMKAGASPERAVDLAVDDCIQKGILSDMLRTHRKEVISMFPEDYDEELHLRTLRREI